MTLGQLCITSKLAYDIKQRLFSIKIFSAYSSSINGEPVITYAGTDVAVETDFGTGSFSDIDILEINKRYPCKRM